MILKDKPRLRPPPSGLGIPPLPMKLLGLLLLPGNRFDVGDVGDLTISVVFGRADRLRGCVPSSYGSRDRSMKEDRCEWAPPSPSWRSSGFPDCMLLLLCFWLITESILTNNSFLMPPSFCVSSLIPFLSSFSPLRSSSQSSSAFVHTN